MTVLPQRNHATRAIAAAALTLIGFGAHAETGNEFATWCKAQQGGFERGMCLGYLDGVIDTHTSFIIAGSGALGFICIPDKVTKGQARDVVLKYMRDNPEQTHLSASTLVIAALREAFPCNPSPAPSASPKPRGSGS